MINNVWVAAMSAAVIMLGAPAGVLADHPTVDFAAGSSGVVATIPAATLPKGTAAVGLRVQYVKPERLSDQELVGRADRGISTHAPDYVFMPSVGAAYGITDDLSIGLSLPYVRRAGIREGEAGEGGAPASVVERGDSSGLGDLTALAKYRFFKDRQGRQAALLFGAKLPTGDTGRTDQHGERFETSAQPGSGSLDPLLGLAVSQSFGRASLDASLVYAFARKGAQDTRLGDRANYNVGLSYRIAGGDQPHDHAAPSARHAHDAWDAVVELNGEWTGKERVGGEVEADSGGNVIYLSPGVRWLSARGWAAVFSIGLPVFQRVRAAHPDNDYRVIAGFSFAL